ncbi:hypothetical protein GF339_18120 [candidate division KSB3 bacterium]|uniref:Uncharacterized protein n=1 Tax=candidate division KSB3 bacterium TaxID=2044937 RepID=A0A9D5Q834_9BACT|nr:hypothetical protein [candidate division KSB3 bacterium]MBD3326506.1 hypothetical protein [candidate division KSB3 bacterium]
MGTPKITYIKEPDLNEEWQEAEFLWMVKTLRSLPQTGLMAVCRHRKIGLAIPDDYWQGMFSEDRIILTLLSNYSLHILQTALRSVLKKPP